MLVKNAREASFSVKGAKLFNLLPIELRNLESDKVDKFKAALDIYLEGVPDEPTIPNLGRAAQTNSLIHQVTYFKPTDRWSATRKTRTH